ncbi:LOW QUALITY PROTEIN: uncharacterized protein LOC124284629 [Haliotis rubra]|uniref:LOW QUALITY PROTEIN: uncharacterized protein LOC124284629 n=1 Tax=Haliotis rubra TaxID=36100 RepID=UPI001EE52979|nr:LOW QUALITY PROTEIN: uncharacterized protein LOC124284629 [Haliotis rubra]
MHAYVMHDVGRKCTWTFTFSISENRNMLLLKLLLWLTVFSCVFGTSSSVGDIPLGLPSGSEIIPVDHIGQSPHLSPSTASDGTCCQALPGICDADGDCTLGYTTCAKLCMCVSGLPSYMCEHMLKKIRDELTSSTQPTINASSATDPSPISTSTSIPVGHSETVDIFPSSSVDSVPGSPYPSPVMGFASDSPSLSHEAYNLTSTPSLDASPVTVSSTPSTPPHSVASDDMIIDKELITPTSKLQTASTEHLNILELPTTLETTTSPSLTHGDIDNRIGQLHPIDPIITSNRSQTNGSNSIDETGHEMTTEDFYSDFIPPTMDSASPCEDCKGTCLFDWNRVPMFECEDGEDHKCHAFSCGDHGECVEDANEVKCECFANYTGIFCEHLCDLDCGEKGDCAFFNETMHCVCNWNYTGGQCEELKTTPAPSVKEYRQAVKSEPWTVIGVCIGLFVLLFLLLVILPYWTWRRRWLPMRKLVHYFQQYEDDDGKEFDAFVSYKSTKEDEDFVVHKLYPKLEKELDFKLCMHFRDFLPGETIANNIMKAVESSRRTIIILSPAYVESEWCMLEYQKAQHEMLKMKHKIIPIVFGDMSQMKNMDKNLKQILNTVTYIDWPGEEDSKKLDRFWKLMVCALPKKKQDSGQSETSGGSSSSDLPLTSVTGSHFPDTLSDDVFPEKIHSSNTSSDEFNVDIIARNDINNKHHGNDTVINLSNDIMKDSFTANGINKPSSDDHVIEIRKLPGHKLKIFRKFKLDLNIGRKAAS